MEMFERVYYSCLAGHFILMCLVMGIMFFIDNIFVVMNLMMVAGMLIVVLSIGFAYLLMIYSFKPRRRK